jgi:histone H3/H4
MQNKATAPAASATEDDTDAAKASHGFPRAIVKRIIMLDADQTRVAADAVDLTVKAAEMFLEALAAKAKGEAAGAARSTISFRDVGRLDSKIKMNLSCRAQSCDAVAISTSGSGCPESAHGRC